MADNPRQWDVDRVRQWAEEAFAFGATLAPRLVENEVDGRVLLDWMDEERLKNDIGIRPLGQRVKILEKIAELACGNAHVDRRISYPLQAPPSSYTPYYSNGDTVRRRQTMQFLPSSSLKPDLILSPFPQNLNPNFNEPQSFTLQGSQSGNIFLRNLTGTPNSIATRFMAVKASSSWPTTPMTPIPTRLALQQAPPVPDTPESLNFTGLDDVEMEEPYPPQPGFMSKLQSARDEVGGPVEQPIESMPKRPLEATPDRPLEATPERPLEDTTERPLVATPLPSHVQKKRKTTHPKHVSFFRSREFKASDVFFSVLEETETSDDFVVYNPIDPPPVGECVYVQKLLKRALVDRYNTMLIDFPHENLRRTVWTPYPNRILAKHQPHIVLVFDVDTTGSCRIYQAPRDTLGIPEPEPSKRKPPKDTKRVVRFSWDDQKEENPFTAGGDHWSFLEKWNHMENDPLLPEFGQSDDEEAAYDDATMREMAEEADQRAGIEKPVLKPLDIAEIRAIVDEEIEKFEDAWTEKELPKVQKRAWRFYRHEKKLRRRSRTIAKYKEEFVHVNERVEGLRGKYETVEWRNARDLRTRCGNLELSIYELKRLQWNIEMLKGNPPPKPVVVDEEDEDEDEEDVEGEMNQMVNIEAVVEDEEGEEEDDLDDEEDDDEEEEDDDMDGFIIDDYDVEQVDEPMDDLDDALDADDEQETPGPDDAAAAIIESAIKSPRRSKRLRQVLDDSEMDTDADFKVVEIVETAEEGPEPAQTQTTMPPSSKGKEPMHSQSTSLPTPPREDDLLIPIKDEPDPRPRTADSTVSLDGYDSDIFMCFGDEEISKFVEATKVHRSIARDYLLRADGKIDRAIDFYYDDLANGLGPNKSRKRRKKGKEREERVSVDLGTDTPLADIFRPSFAAVLPKPWRHLREFLSNLIPEDLHQTLVEISELPNVDPTTAFLEGVTAEDCGRYWSLYRTYLFDLFGKVVDTLEPEMAEQLRKPAEFQKFYDRLTLFLNVDPPGPSSSKRPSSSQMAPPPADLPDIEPSSQVSAPSSPEKSKKRDKGKGVHKAKSKKPAKPISKSVEENLQDKELKRIADREKLQKKKGTYMTTTAEGDILINPGKKASDDAVTFHPRLAAVMKPHQIEGAQFIWRHVITMQRNRGTLLAHTMGLGKTLQVIAVLITLASVASDAKVEMTASLKKDNRRVLVVCPPTIVTNWKQEFKLWTPPECKASLGQVVTIDLVKATLRPLKIQRWFNDGGVLIVGYSQFRALLMAKNTAPEAIEQRRKWLLNPGPDIIVADEAHLIKNPKAKISGLFSQIKTGSRIATTGSPLSNHLEEYFWMMEWINPTFLGSLPKFTAQYITPIKNGLYQDSTAPLRKESQRRLERLKAMLDKKIHRKDISVIQDDLPPKTEFVLTVPLTSLQQQLYEGALEQTRTTGLNNNGLFKWTNILRLICNHPALLSRYITDQDRKGKEKEKAKTAARKAKSKPMTDGESSEAVSRDATPEDDPLPEASELQWAKDIFDAQEKSRLGFTAHSNKVIVAVNIVTEAIAQGESVLIFFHSIPTLLYVQEKLKRRHIDVNALWGDTPMNERQEDVDRFNRATKAVYLISARTGALGLNITSASRVVLFDFAWNPVHDQQAVGRAYRLGQKRHVYVYRLGTYGTYEEIFFTDNIFKLNLAKRVIDKQNPNRYGLSGKTDYRRYFRPLASVDDAAEYDAESFLNKDPVLDEILEKSKSGKGPTIVTLDLSETFHKDDNEDLLTNEELEMAKKEAELEELAREEGWLNDPSLMDASQRKLMLTLFPEDGLGFNSILGTPMG